MPVVTMPRLSDTMSEGTVARWLKKEGEEVSRGEILAEIETDKATMELEAFDSGTLARIVQPEGSTVPVGAAIAIVLKPGEQMPEGMGVAPEPPVATGTSASAPGLPAEAPAATEAQTPAPERSAEAPALAPTGAPAPAPERPAEAAAAAPAAEERVSASPVARKVALDLGVDLSMVTGTGPGGRIVREDVENYARESAAPAPAAPPPTQAPEAATPVAPRPLAAAPEATEDVEYVDLSTMQRTIVRRMVESKTTIPDFTVTSAIRMDAASDLRSALNSALEGEVRISYNDLVLKAVALTLVKFPEVNGSFRDNGIVLNHRVHVGFAAAMAGGLVVPVVRDCDKKSLKAVAQETAVLTEKARQGKLTLAEMEGSTFNVSNMGMYDVEHFEAIITPPNAAVLAVGSVKDEPVVDNGQMAVGKVMRVTLTCDHRVFYGATAAQFLQELKRLLERPMNLIM